MLVQLKNDSGEDVAINPGAVVAVLPGREFPAEMKSSYVMLVSREKIEVRMTVAEVVALLNSPLPLVPSWPSVSTDPWMPNMFFGPTCSNPPDPKAIAELRDQIADELAKDPIVKFVQD